MKTRAMILLLACLPAFAGSRQEAPRAPDSIDGSWGSLRPEVLRKPLAIVLRRNPMQLVSKPGTPAVLVSGNGTNALAETLSAALPGRPQAVLRSSLMQALLIGRRCYVPGTDVELRASPPSPRSIVAARLKAIERDRLVFLVSIEGAGGKEISEVSIALDSFLHER